MTKLKELSELSLLSLYGIHKQKEKSRLQGGKYILKNEKSILNLWLHDTGLSPGSTTNQLCDFGKITWSLLYLPVSLMQNQDNNDIHFIGHKD